MFTFLTGEGGFLQEFLHGSSGLRWHGRVFDLALGARTTTVTLRSGAPMTVQTPAGTRSLAAGSPLILPTRGTGGPGHRPGHPEHPERGPGGHPDHQAGHPHLAGGPPLAPYTVQTRRDLAHARDRAARAGTVDARTFAGVSAGAVRVRIPATRSGGQNPRLADLKVSG